MKRHFTILFLADTHLGIDLPARPRIERRRRGHDFFDNFVEALRPAIHGEVDAVVHGGDVLYRSRVSAELVYRSFEPLLAVAEAGVPVFVVPGNHERGRIPYPLLVQHPNLHIFSTPMTHLVDVNGISVGLSGFPYEYASIGVNFSRIVTQTEWSRHKADIRLLCMHHVVEGAQVGAQDFTFRRGTDIIRGRDIPRHFAAVLSGHIHRCQTLTADLRGQALGAPVIYPGAIERTAFDERLEEKGYLILIFSPEGRPGGTLERRTFVALKTRPMVVLDLDSDGRSPDDIVTHISERLAALDPNSVVRISVTGDASDELLRVLTARRIRDLAPATMNIDVRFVMR